MGIQSLLRKLGLGRAARTESSPPEPVPAAPVIPAAPDVSGRSDAEALAAYKAYVEELKASVSEQLTRANENTARADREAARASKEVARADKETARFKKKIEGLKAELRAHEQKSAKREQAAAKKIMHLHGKLAQKDIELKVLRETNRLLGIFKENFLTIVREIREYAKEFNRRTIISKIIERDFNALETPHVFLDFVLSVMGRTLGLSQSLGYHMERSLNLGTSEKNGGAAPEREAESQASPGGGKDAKQTASDKDDEDDAEVEVEERDEAEMVFNGAAETLTETLAEGSTADGIEIVRARLTDRSLNQVEQCTEPLTGSLQKLAQERLKDIYRNGGVTTRRERSYISVTESSMIAGILDVTANEFLHWCTQCSEVRLFKVLAKKERYNTVLVHNTTDGAIRTVIAPVVKCRCRQCGNIQDISPSELNDLEYTLDQRDSRHRLSAGTGEVGGEEEVREVEAAVKGFEQRLDEMVDKAERAAADASRAAAAQPADGRTTAEPQPADSSTTVGQQSTDSSTTAGQPSANKKSTENESVSVAKEAQSDSASDRGFTVVRQPADGSTTAGGQSADSEPADGRTYESESADRKSSRHDEYHSRDKERQRERREIFRDIKAADRTYTIGTGTDRVFFADGRELIEPWGLETGAYSAQPAFTKSVLSLGLLVSSAFLFSQIGSPKNRTYNFFQGQGLTLGREQMTLAINSFARAFLRPVTRQIKRDILSSSHSVLMDESKNPNNQAA